MTASRRRSSVVIWLTTRQRDGEKKKGGFNAKTASDCGFGGRDVREAAVMREVVEGGRAARDGVVAARQKAEIVAGRDGVEPRLELIGDAADHLADRAREAGIGPAEADDRALVEEGRGARRERGADLRLRRAGERRCGLRQ